MSIETQWITVAAQKEYDRRKQILKTEWHDRAQEGMTQRKQRGGRSGAIPLGYLQEEGVGVFGLVPDPEKAELVSEMWPLALRYPIRKIEQIMERKGLRSRHNIPLSTPAIRVILLNPVYLGGPHKALADRETFEKVLLRLKRQVEGKTTIAQ